MKPALLLIDLQNDYLREPAMAEVVRRAASLLADCRQRGVPVIHVWTTVRRDDDRRMPHWKQAGRWQCEAGTDGHAPPAALRPLDTEPIVHKTGFSPFVENALEPVLRATGCDTLWLAGVHLHACVRATALDAYQRGYHVVILSDAVGSDDPLHAAVTQQYLARRGISFESAPVPPLNVTAQPVRDPVAVLAKFDEWVAAESESLARQIATEIRKPIRYARAEVQRTRDLLRAARRWAAEPREVGRVRYRPVGRIGIITPWNNPLAIPVGKIAPALLYGNAVVWKPSPLAAKISARLAAQLPVQFVEGAAATALAVMEQVDAVTLTGSSAAGFAAQAVCGRRRIPLQAELGGNNAAIVWADADLAEAAAQIAEGAFGFAGQRCTANRRVVVAESVADEFLTHLRRATAALRGGDLLDEATQVGPLITRAAADRVAAVVARAAVIFAAPAGTVVAGDDPASEIVQEETFGPVLVVQRARDWAGAIRLGNGVRQGLVAALFARDPRRQAEFLETAQAGILKINLATTDADAESPFGGWKESGLGPPEHGASDREFYTRTQAVYTR